MSIRRAKPKRIVSKQLERALVASIGLTLALLLAFLTSSGIQRLDDQTMQIWFFDVGQGDATFVITPNGKQVLIDAGPSASVLSKLGSVMPFWDRSIDAVVITHPDADHITGFAEVFNRYDVAVIIESGADATTAIAQEVDEAIELEQAAHVLAKTGDEFWIDGVFFEVFWPGDVEEGEIVQDRNEASVVMQMTYGETSVLLMGDAEEGTELALLESLRPVDVLKAGHHGSVSSSSPGFISLTHPRFSVISCGENNRYGHPHPIVIDRLQSVESNIFRTDIQGDILLSSDGGEPIVQLAPLMF
jgi:competence protein ComEC